MADDHHAPYKNPTLTTRNLVDIAIALSGESDVNQLLEMIVSEALRISCADAGTLYKINKEGTHLDFAIMQNISLGKKLGGRNGEAINLPPVPLFTKNKEPNDSNISSFAALTGKIINIEDVYTAIGFNFSGYKRYDKKTGYRSTSMLVIPLYDYENEILGVLQLLNAIDPVTKKVIPFNKNLMDITSALSSLASVALTNRQLIYDLQHLLYAFIKSIGTTIDAKSHYTACHINRVVELTMLIANEINCQKTGPFAQVEFTNDELEELKIATWMHDLGKIITPKNIMDKSSKLETITDRIDMIKLRFELIAKDLENRFLMKKNTLISHGEDKNTAAIIRLKEEMEIKKEQLKSDIAFICECNSTKSFMDDDSVKRLEKIRQQVFILNDVPCPYITTDELENLTIKKGNLTTDERKIIEKHVVVSRKLLQGLPFPKKLRKVSEIAGSHHEKIDGSGYPDGKAKADLNLQTRILTIADIFEALTAADRPYKLPIPLSKAMSILESMQEEQQLDKNILDLFKENRLYDQYSKKHLKQEQIDI